MSTFPNWRTLTGDEVLLCRTVFGSAINYGLVKVYHKSYFPFGAQNNNVAMAPNGNIYFDPQGTLHKVDFAKADIHAKALFVHEMTHVWQHQSGINVRLRGIFQRRYKYLPLTPGKSFKQYGIEQQGDIVRDFFYQLNGYRKNAWPSIDTYRTLIPFIDV